MLSYPCSGGIQENNQTVESFHHGRNISKCNTCLSTLKEPYTINEDLLAHVKTNHQNDPGFCKAGCGC